MGNLYLVATPIGNLEDITLRAVRLMREAVLIAAEDTRQTQKLLQRYDIHTPTISYHEHNKLSRVNEILAALAAGDVALVSDAGTPGLNDPGYELVVAAVAAGHVVSPVPGPASPIAALVSSGLPTDQFLYLGYLPRRSIDRRRVLEKVASLPYTLIFLETPHRLKDSLSDLESVLGDRPIAVARELTKIHEEIFRGTLPQAISHFESNPPRGEFTLVVGGLIAGQAEPWSEQKLLDAARQAMDAGQPHSQLASDLAAQSGWQRREIYRLLVQLKDQGD
jgi:16S rRNA (cytidine1402-2'-O)-methyltransferase